MDCVVGSHDRLELSITHDKHNHFTHYGNDGELSTCLNKTRSMPLSVTYACQFIFVQRNPSNQKCGTVDPL